MFLSEEKDQERRYVRSLGLKLNHALPESLQILSANGVFPVELINLPTQSFVIVTVLPRLHEFIGRSRYPVLEARTGCALSGVCQRLERSVAFSSGREMRE